MYKDKDKQREAVKAATQRYRAKKGDSALSGSKEGLENARGLPVVDELSDTQPVIPSCDTFPKATRLPTHKRGKDIKCFADLPLDVQKTIAMMSRRDGKIDQVDKAKRTTAAIKYQHLFPDRYEPTNAASPATQTTTAYAHLNGERNE